MGKPKRRSLAAIERRREYTRAWMAANREKYLATKARYRATHADHIKAQYAAYRAANREKILARHREAYRNTAEYKARELLRELRARTAKARKLSSVRRWQKANKERHRELKKKWWARYYAANKEKILCRDRIRNRAYYAANPARHRAKLKAWGQGLTGSEQHKQLVAARKKLVVATISLRSWERLLTNPSE